MNDSVGRPMLRRAAVAFFLAGALGALSFWLWVYPEASNLLGPRFTVVLARLLDAPVSALNICLPSFLRSGIAAQFSSTTYCFPQSIGTEWLHYLAVAIPAYLVIFSSPLGIRWLWRRLRAHSSGGQEDS
jgi:hypothetical protein